MSRVALLFATVLALSGCVSVFPEEKLAGVDRSLTLAALRSDPDRFVQQRVVLAGEVIETRPRIGSTEIEVLSRPLSDRDAPGFTDQSDGRFLLVAPDFLDPAVYGPGRRISVVGTVTGSQERSLGQAPYRYVVVAIDQLYLWPSAYPYRAGSPWLDPLARPYYWPYYW
jgi:outer membrane lipoprotein